MFIDQIIMSPTPEISIGIQISNKYWTIFDVPGTDSDTGVTVMKKRQSHCP